MNPTSTWNTFPSNWEKDTKLRTKEDSQEALEVARTQVHRHLDAHRAYRSVDLATMSDHPNGQANEHHFSMQDELNSDRSLYQLCASSSFSKSHPDVLGIPQGSHEMNW
jgi:hypothetical protein